MITIGFFFYVTLVNTQWLLTTSPSSCQHTILPGQQTSTHTVLQALVCGGLSNPYLWHTEKQCKRQVYWPWIFHLCDTLPHPSSSMAVGSSQLTQGKARPTTVLLLPYRKQNLLLSCIPRHFANTLCIALYHLHFCVSPASVECHSLCTSSAMALFSCRVDALLIKLVGCWHSDAMLCYLHVQSCPRMWGLSRLMLAGGNPQLLVEATTMPLPNPSLFVG